MNHASQEPLTNERVPQDSGRGPGDIFRIVTWNVQGLNKHVNNIDLIEYLSDFDIIFLCETWSKLSKEFDNFLDGFTNFDRVRVKNPQAIRNSGGVNVFISNRLVDLNQITRICSDWDDSIVLHCNFSSLYDVNDVIFYFLYVSPERSTIYDNVSEPNGILQMQDKFHE